MPLVFLLLMLMGTGAFVFAADAPVLRVLPPLAGPSLLKSGDFENAAWQKQGAGFEMAPGEGRAASSAIRCENAAPKDERGARQTLELNRTRALPLTVRGWSKAQNVSGSPDSGYALYVDLVYTDGTPLWGQVATFQTGTHDWEESEVVIYPKKPVRSISVYCLFRGHSGKVWFDDITMHEASGEVLRWEGAPVQMQKPLDGASFLVRDVAANSNVFAFEKGGGVQLGLKLQSQSQRVGAAASPGVAAPRGELRTYSGPTFLSIELSSETPRDRAVTFAYALPLDMIGGNWGDDIRRTRKIEGREIYSNLVSVGAGATGQASLYPLAAVWNEHVGRAIGLDMDQPALYRLSYHAGLKQLQLACDFGFTSEARKAKIRFVVFPFDPRHGFRGAWEKYTKLFPQHFAPRSREQGLWMPFTDVAKVPGFADFQFKFKEGTNNVPFDDANGILTFRYTEPMTWWMPMPKEMPRTLENALRVRDELAQKGNRMAQASLTSAMNGPDGQPQLQFKNEPWCDGAVWSLNPNPALPGAVNGATPHWNADIKKKLYGVDAKGVQDGEYLDSLEGYVTANLNYNRAHFAHSTVPLVFDTKTKQPALWKALAVWEFTRWLADDLHAMNKLTFANSVPHRFTFLCGQLDVMGTETNWFRNGQWTPVSDDEASLWRTMSGQKPYLLLQNTRFDALTPELVEKYFQRSLFYGFWPGMFSHNAANDPYWQNPQWIERDRALWKKYLPLIRRVTEAGWQPVTHAITNVPGVQIERFGDKYFTLLNDTAQSQTVNITFDADLKLRAFGVRELIDGKTLPMANGAIRLELPSGRVALLEITK